MKKIIASILLMFCCVLLISGCNKLEEKYWETTADAAQELFDGENYKQIVGNYNSNLTLIMNAAYGESYNELTLVLDPLFKSTIYYAEHHFGDFRVIPKNDNSAFKKEIKKLNNSIAEFKESVDEYVQLKSEYLSHITSSSEEFANNTVELGRVLIFKRQYISLIEKAQELSTNLYNARKVGYYDFSDYANIDVVLEDPASDVSLAIATTSLKINECALKIVRAYNVREMASEYQEYWQASQNFYNNTILKFRENQTTLSENTKQKMHDWMGAYQLFCNDVKIFNDVIDKLNLKLLSNKEYDSEEYAKETQNAKDELHVEYYLEFHEKIEKLAQYANNLFN